MKLIDGKYQHVSSLGNILSNKFIHPNEATSSNLTELDVIMITNYMFTMWLCNKNAHLRIFLCQKTTENRIAMNIVVELQFMNHFKDLVKRYPRKCRNVMT